MSETPAAVPLEGRPSAALARRSAVRKHRKWALWGVSLGAWAVFLYSLGAGFLGWPWPF